MPPFRNCAARPRPCESERWATACSGALQEGRPRTPPSPPGGLLCCAASPFCKEAGAAAAAAPAFRVSSPESYPPRSLAPVPLPGSFSKTIEYMDRQE